MKVFNKSESKKIEPNPYLDARQHWNERYGHALSSAKNWRILAIVEAMTILVLISGYIYLSSRSTLVPFVLKVDQAGNTIAAIQPKQSKVDIGLIKTILAQWIEDMRGITPDTIEQKKRLTRVYSKIANNSIAKTNMDELYNEMNYFEASKKYIISVNISSVLHIEKGRMSVEWSETKRKRNGDLLDITKKKATIAYEIGQLSTEERRLINNPIGIYVTDFNISQIFTK